MQQIADAYDPGFDKPDAVMQQPRAYESFTDPNKKPGMQAVVVQKSAEELKNKYVCDEQVSFLKTVPERKPSPVKLAAGKKSPVIDLSEEPDELDVGADLVKPDEENQVAAP